MRKTCVVLAVVMGLTGCSAQPGSGPSAPPPVSPPAAASPEKVVLESFVGDKLDDVEHALDQLKLKHEAVSGDGKKVLVAANWTVTGQDPAAGTEVKTGSTIRLTVAEAASPAPSGR
ncbi:PASTA domain-containing protein [Arthrobacter sp. ISL-85]|uniref:PASTA domain-containing protein n=1 Tax=Arthrobacter sp. ISL-85 TaxID=2819115 RepID=UPI001BE9EDD4|nr:PASTA domain-containing protein [Arthrobacter sp. ISL-85]MBT2568825.1 PASTA domain-containing protein [Arthrobacter sp. ISL-85]